MLILIGQIERRLPAPRATRYHDTPPNRQMMKSPHVHVGGLRARGAPRAGAGACGSVTTGAHLDRPRLGAGGDGDGARGAKGANGGASGEGHDWESACVREKKKESGKVIDFVACGAFVWASFF